MSEGSARTWFSGRSAPEDHQGISPSSVIAIVLVVLSPLGALTAAALYALFSVGRFSWQVIAGLTAAYLPVWMLLDSGAPTMHTYLTPWRDLIAAVRSADLTGTLSTRWPDWLAAQLPLSLLLGGLVATVFSWWRWVRRATWEADDHARRPGPWALLRRHRAVQAIASATRGPRDGVTVGVTSMGHTIVQTEREAAAHTLVAGASGSGKTTGMLIGIRDLIRRGEPVFYLDLKGSDDVPQQVAAWCARYNRRFLHWTIQNPREPYRGPADGPAFYDPIGRGDPSRRKDLLVAAQKWDVEYYKSVVENYLQLAFQISDRTSPAGADSFAEITLLLNYTELSARASTLVTPAVLDAEGITMLHRRQPWQDYLPYVTDPELRTLLEAVAHTVHGLDKNEQELSAIRNMRARLQTLTQSTAGAWLRKSPTGERDIDLRAVVDEGWVVVCSLDSSNYRETASQIGGLIIQDLNTLSSELRHNPAPHPFHVYVDEFSAIQTDNVLGLLARGRDARMPVTLSTQALADLTRADPTFPDQVLAIISSFLVMRANTEADATIFAGLTSKRTVYKRQYGIEMTSGMPGSSVGVGAATGAGFIREDEEYQVKPQEFQTLGQGEVIYVAKTPSIRVVKDCTVVPESAAAVAVATSTVARWRRLSGLLRSTRSAPVDLPARPAGHPRADNPQVTVASTADQSVQAAQVSPAGGRSRLPGLPSPAPDTSTAGLRLPVQRPVAGLPVTPPASNPALGSLDPQRGLRAALAGPAATDPAATNPSAGAARPVLAALDAAQTSAAGEERGHALPTAPPAASPARRPATPLRPVPPPTRPAIVRPQPVPGEGSAASPDLPSDEPTGIRPGAMFDPSEWK